jgi:hypothetical protein
MSLLTGTITDTRASDGERHSERPRRLDSWSDVELVAPQGRREEDVAVLTSNPQRQTEGKSGRSHRDVVSDGRLEGPSG